MKYIGIDLGSSFIKAVLMDFNAQRLIAHDKTVSPGKRKHRNPNYFEIPARALANTVRSLIDRYTEEYDDVEGVVISTQMHGFVYSVPEQEDMYISWQDMRCMDKMPGKDISYLKWMEENTPPSLMNDNGVYIKPSLGVCNLYTLLDENPDMPRDGTLYTLGSYVIHALTGNNVCHITNAAPLGLADVAHHCWDGNMLRRMKLTEIKLPRLAEDDYEICGEYVSGGCRLKIHPDYGDMQVAILGSHIGTGDVVVNIATGAQVIRYDKNFRPGNYEIRPYFENSYLNTISNMPSGRNLDVLIRFICEIAEQATGERPDEQFIWKKVHEEELKEDEDLRVNTAFYKNPHFRSGGAIEGITQNNLHLSTIFYAAFEDMARTYWHYIQEFGEDTQSIRRIICAGGVNWKTPEIRMMLRRVSGKECLLSPMADEALSGMYRLGLMCGGKCKNLEECADYPLVVYEGEQTC